MTGGGLLVPHEGMIVSMDGYRCLLLLLVFTGSLCTSAGCCFDRFGSSSNPLPPALPPTPTLEQVIEVVNRNNARINSYWSPQARLTVQGFPTLRASVAYERPLRFRLRADTALTGPELDLGSNDQQFWFWVKRNQPPAVFYCRHDQFPSGRARQMIPIDPYWMIEALGTAEFDRGLPHQGPFPLSKSNDRIEIRTVRDSLTGSTIKSTIIDAVRGYVLEQRVYDAHGRLLAESIAGGHRQDPASGLVMPTSVKISCPPAHFSMTVDLGKVQINRLPENAAALWAMPHDNGMQFVDLCSPTAPSPTVPPPAISLPAVSFRSRAQTRQWPPRAY